MYLNFQILYESKILPYPRYCCEIKSRIFVDPFLSFLNKAIFGPISSDTGGTRHRFAEMVVDRGSGDGFNPLQLASSREVEFLKKKFKWIMREIFF